MTRILKIKTNNLKIHLQKYLNNNDDDEDDDGDNNNNNKFIECNTRGPLVLVFYTVSQGII